MSWVRRSMSVWLLLLAFIIILVITFPIVWHFADRNRIESVKTSPSPGFPIVIFNSDSAEVIDYEHADDYIKTHPNSTFLVPSEQEADEMLAKSLKTRGSTVSPKVKVRQISPSRQSVEIGLYGDWETVVWYEATDKEVYPKSIKEFGPLFALIVLFYSAVISVVICGFGYGLIKVFKASNKHAFNCT
jgi:hypothetical protein